MSDQLPERCCGRCRHYVPRRHTSVGICGAPLPSWLENDLTDSQVRESVHRHPENGESCPAFVAKETETK